MTSVAVPPGCGCAMFAFCGVARGTSFAGAVLPASGSPGAPLTKLPSGVFPKPVLSASRGEFSNILTEAVPNNVPGHWRTQFDLTVTGTEPVEMRCYLRNGDEILSETWLYQYHPAF